MKKIKAIIEKGNEGLYSIYLPDIPGMYGTGETEAEAKEALLEAVDSAKEYVEGPGSGAIIVCSSLILSLITTMIYQVLQNLLSK